MLKFLVIQTASIGDVILATPVLEKLNGYYPGAQIDILVKKGNEALFQGHPFVCRTLVWDKTSGKYRNLYALLLDVRKERYDYVINVQRYGGTGLLTAMSGATYKTGFDKNPFSLFFNRRIKHVFHDPGLHETERNHRLIAGITDNQKGPVRLYPGKKDFDAVKKYRSSDYICIAPASLWFTKQYPVEKWVEFVKAVPPGITVIFTGSGKDEKICRDIIQHSGHPDCLTLAGQLSLLQTAALMAGAKMNFVNDSAPQHLASAMNAPVTAIFCSTVPSFGFGPLSDDARVIETDVPLDCRPCGLHGHSECPEGHFKCAMTISNEKLLKRL
ncbi:MAG: glycosyltransferase family 9 protein [Bacteroidales bacterium]